MNQTYVETARLMTGVVQLVFVDKTFALKGCMAINMFILAGAQVVECMTAYPDSD